MPLSYNQYVQRRKSKFAGLTVAVKRARYQQYISSQNQTKTPPSRPKAKRSRKARTRQSRQQARAQLDPAVGPFLALVGNPFRSSGVGLPVFPSPPSQKLTTWCKTTFVVGTGGFGFAAAFPYLDNTASNANFYYSTSGYIGNSISANQSTAGVSYLNASGSNNPYAISTFSSNTTLQQRLVCAGIRLRYSGTANNASGSMIAFVHPEHNDCGSFTKASILAFEGCDFTPVTRKWVSAVWVPVHRTELEYTNTPYTPSQLAQGTASTGIPIIVMVPDGTAGNTYDVEFFCHYEVIGTISADKTPNYVSPTTEPILSRLRGSVQSYAGGTGANSNNNTNTTAAPGLAAKVAKLALQAVVPLVTPKSLAGVGNFLARGGEL